ncbi:HAD family hydrolase [Croceivirga sp. JEA036]|uniref:HAD family hydrolase n=1 Tax=Croceivirga sp. JEA036 TaxID=2721162 RepID=UPI001439CA08|nr:HAD family hydrolase [Croceivirga sp. JEA036]NJB37992.1 HAD family phosphatase [Croceivirga sp. JEA036]
MDFSRIKMVVTDMDGTLLNSNHEVSHQFYQIFEKLKERNIQFVAASGRQYHSMASKLESVKDDVLFIAENGAMIKRMNKTIMTTPLATKYIQTIINKVHSIADAHPVLCTENTAFVGNTSDQFLTLLKEYYKEFTVVDDLSTIKEEILKIAIYHFTDSEKHLYPHLQFLENELKVKVSGAHWVDVSDSNAHKGFALEKVMTQHGITADELMVFGDYNNDLEMLQLSNYSYAMANAHPNVKKTAKYETLSNDENGVEFILNQIIQT